MSRRRPPTEVARLAEQLSSDERSGIRPRSGQENAIPEGDRMLAGDRLAR